MAPPDVRHEIKGASKGGRKAVDALLEAVAVARPGAHGEISDSEMIVGLEEMLALELDCLGKGDALYAAAHEHPGRNFLELFIRRNSVAHPDGVGLVFETAIAHDLVVRIFPKTADREELLALLDELARLDIGRHHENTRERVAGIMRNDFRWMHFQPLTLGQCLEPELVFPFLLWCEITGMTGVNQFLLVGIAC